MTRKTNREKLEALGYKVIESYFSITVARQRVKEINRENGKVFMRRSRHQWFIFSR